MASCFLKVSFLPKALLQICCVLLSLCNFTTLEIAFETGDVCLV